MTRFFVRLLVFIAPVILANFVLLRMGFRFHEKNDYLIHRLANAEPPANTLNFLFVGTSRTNCGISPDDFVKPFREAGIKANAVNLGIDGSNAFTGLYLAKNKLNKYDYLVIEIFPGDPVSADSQKFVKDIPAEKLNDFLTYHMGKYFLFQNSYSILLYCLNRNPIYHMDCHANGFNELEHGNDARAINRAKNKWVSSAGKPVLNTISFSDHYDRYSDFLRSNLRACTTGIFFLLMPADGKVKEYQDRYLKNENTLFLLKRNFPDGSFILSDNDSSLSKFKTFEDSHLDGKSAKEFSKTFGTIILSSVIPKKEIN